MHTNADTSTEQIALWITTDHDLAKEAQAVTKNDPDGSATEAHVRRLLQPWRHMDASERHRAAQMRDTVALAEVDFLQVRDEINDVQL